MTLMTGTSSAQISTPSVTRVSKDLIKDKPSSLSIEIIEDKDEATHGVFGGKG